MANNTVVAKSQQPQQQQQQHQWNAQQLTLTVVGVIDTQVKFHCRDCVKSATTKYTQASKLIIMDINKYK